jgi:AcrR family transcriptional regulator
MAGSVRENGFRGASIADVVKRARTSRRTFYENFADREDCFLSLFDVSNAVFVARITASLDATKAWQEQIDDALAMYLQVVRNEPAITIAFAHELAALGDRGAERKRREMDSFAALLIELVERVRRTHSELRPMPQSAAYVITSGLRESVAHTLTVGGDLDEIAATASELISGVVSP